MSNFVSTLMERAKQLEASISQSMANHNALIGALSEVKMLIEGASKLAEMVSPCQHIVEPIEIEQSPANDVDSSLASSSE